MKLTDDALFRQQSLIGGAWRDAGDGTRFAARNPATGEIVGHAPHSTAADVERAIEAAHAAFAGWRSPRRAQLLLRRMRASFPGQHVVLFNVRHCLEAHHAYPHRQRSTRKPLPPDRSGGRVA